MAGKTIGHYSLLLLKFATKLTHVFIFVFRQEHLAGAVVCPSDEDSRTFTISCASGDILKLRAINARARQEWVDGLRNIAECHTQSIGSQFEMLPPREVVAASDAFGEARQQLHNTELW